MKIFILNIFLISFSIFFSASNANAQRTISVSGNNWNVNVSPVTEAGLDYLGSYESATNQMLLSVSIPFLLGSGKVSVHYEVNTNWNSSLNLSVRRTGNGSTLCLLCSITGGTAYQSINTFDTELFRINGGIALTSYTNIPIQLMISGISVILPATNYQSSIVFTISDL